MSEELFRKKSLEKIKSPENMSEYIRVVKPGVLLLLGAIIILMIGVCIWGVFGKIETKIVVDGKAQNGAIFCQLDSDNIDSIEEGMTVRVKNVEGEVINIDRRNDIVVSEMDIEDGVYLAEIIIEQINPFSFVFN